MATKLEVANIAAEFERLEKKLDELEIDDPYIIDAEAFAKQASVSVNKHLATMEDDKPVKAKKAKSE